MSGKTLLKMSVFAFFLLGCGEEMTPEKLYSSGKPLFVPAYKADVPTAVVQNDILDCRIEAAGRVPQNVHIRTSPSFSTPIQTTCNNIGYSTICNTTGGQTYGGDTYSVDANADLRNGAQQQCMAQRGYRSVSIPPCPQGVAPSHLKFDPKSLPLLGRNTCYIAKDGLQVIGNL